MNLKLLPLICFLAEVTCECDSPFGYLGDLVQGYFFGDCSNATSFKVTDVSFNDTDDFNSTEVDIGKSNSSLSVFDISDIGRSFGKLLDDLTAFLKVELDGMLKLNHEIDLHKELENDTEIFIKTFELTKILDKDQNVAEELPIDIIKNNFTEFNNEFEALKEEIEKNLQAELEAFISKITDNDTLDWEDVTKTLSDTVTDKAKPHKETNEKLELLKYLSATESSNNISANNPIEVFKNDTVESVANDVILKALHKNKPNEVINTTTSNVPFIKMKFGDDTDTETYKPAEAIATAETNATTKKTEDNVSSTTTTAAKPTEVTSLKTVVTETTFKMGPTYLPTVKPVETTTKVKEPSNNEDTKLDAQKKSSIDFKLLENVKVNEITKEDASYYDIEDDNTTDYPIIDYIDLYKDTTNEDTDYTPTEIAVVNEVDNNKLDNAFENEDKLGNGIDNEAYINDTSSIFPWIATIFIRNDSNNQFDYYCDGVLLSETHVVTAARCLTYSNATVKAEDVLVFLGKRSLQSTGEGEVILRIKQLQLHENFTSTSKEKRNDLAILQLEEPVVYNDKIRAACLADGEETEPGFTTAWAAKLSIIRFLAKSKSCGNNSSENTFCATFGDQVALCPSFGGSYNVYNTKWCVRGIRSADPSTRGYCIDKTVTYTDLNKYRHWLEQMLSVK